MPSPSVAFNHGVASGDPYSNSVILWTRLSPPQDFKDPISVTWQASLSAGFEPGTIVDSGTFSTSASRDWTVKVEADGLTADTTYYYRFRVGDGESIVGQTKTLPVDSEAVRLAVFSCANFPAADTFAAYGRAAAIQAVNPYDALVHLGDYIYEYGPGGYGAAEDAATDRGFLPNREIVSLDDYRQRYAQYHTDQNLQDLRAAAPLIAIWDDHETANDSWSGGAQNHQSETEGEWIARRDAALKAYYEWLPIREPLLRQGVDKGDASTPLTQGYRSFSFGDVLDLHVLETRLTARDEQLDYPDAAAVQARIGAILASPTDLTAYATRLGVTPPATEEAFLAFGTALAPTVTQELVIAAVQLAWGDPSRDLIGDTQLAWLQNQMGQSNAAWQVLGQQVLMQSMAVPAKLLLNAGDPSLLDEYAAPLQKLATGTAFAELSAAEQALFAEGGKIPYNLDAWDGYGVERETILQTALAQGKRLISLAGDTHNAWAGVLDTMTTAGTKPAGTAAGVEFATPGVTSPGLEKYFPGADGYIRGKYPSVDGLDGLFRGYVSGLKYADLNRRGFLDLTVSKEEAVGTFQLLNSNDPLSGKPAWSSETVVSSASFALSTSAEARPLISWQPGWQELDLTFGLAIIDNPTGAATPLDPAAYASVPRDGVQLADVTVLGSTGADRIFTGIGSLIDADEGNDELFNDDSLGNNTLIGGKDIDSFYLKQSSDLIIGGSLFGNHEIYGTNPYTALSDITTDKFYIDSSSFQEGKPPVTISDFSFGTDQAFIDGLAVTGDWQQITDKLAKAGVLLNAIPHIDPEIKNLKLKLLPGSKVDRDLSSFYSDLNKDSLSTILINTPSWLTVKGNILTFATPAGITQSDLDKLQTELAVYDGKSINPFTLKLSLSESIPMKYITTEGKLINPVMRASSGNLDSVPKIARASISPTFTDKPAKLDIGKTSVNFDIKPNESSASKNTAVVAMDLAPMLDGMTPTNKRLAYFTFDTPGEGAAPVAKAFTYDPIKKAGAQFFDLDGKDGAETVRLKFIDNGYGDKNPAVGIIEDPSTAGVVELAPILTSIGSVLSVEDPNDRVSPAAVVLRSSITSRANSVNQLGYVAFSNLEKDTTITYEILKNRANILFANLESGDVPSLEGINFSKDISVINGQKLVFFEVVDSTLDKLMAQASDVTEFGTNFRTLTLNGSATTTSGSSGGNTLKIDLVNSSLSIGDLISTDVQESPIVDFTSLSGTSLTGSVTVAREASYNSTIGFYKIENTSGAVRDSLGALIQPDDIVNYKKAALSSNNIFSDFGSLTSANGGNTSTNLATFSDAGLIAPYAIVANTGETFFAFGKANSDGINHFRAIGNNSFGLEDVKGGFDLDYDDMIVSFNFKLAIA